jgi:hypothetical protein
MGEKLLKSMVGKPAHFKVEKELKHEREIVINLGKHDRKKYAVVKKDLPEGLPTEWNGTKITWFNNFGIRALKKDGTLGAFANIRYTIILEKDPKETLFYFDGKKVQELKCRPIGKTNRVWAALDLGDPPAGGGVRGS